MTEFEKSAREMAQKLKQEFGDKAINAINLLLAEYDEDMSRNAEHRCGFLLDVKLYIEEGEYEPLRLSHVEKTLLSMSKEELEASRKEIMKHSETIETPFGNIVLIKQPQMRFECVDKRFSLAGIKRIIGMFYDYLLATFI